VHVDPHYADPTYGNDPGTNHALTQVLRLGVNNAVCLAALGVWGLCPRLMCLWYSASRRGFTGGGALWPTGWVDGIASAMSKTVRCGAPCCPLAALAARATLGLRMASDGQRRRRRRTVCAGLLERHDCSRCRCPRRFQSLRDRHDLETHQPNKWCAVRPMLGQSRI
jgi:hypothetical protein